MTRESAPKYFKGPVQKKMEDFKAFGSFEINQIFVHLSIDIFKVDALAWQKNSKCHFLEDIENSFHEVTHIGLEPHHFFSF